MKSFRAPVLAHHWLLSGVIALAIAGLYSLVLVVARAPQLAKLPLFTRLFHEALVVHVDLSVVVWFLAIACMFWSRAAGRSGVVEKAGLLSFCLGALLITLSPLDPNGEALMSNYIPVIASPVFFIGLMLLMCGVALQIGHFFLHATPSAHIPETGAAVVTLLALVMFVWSSNLIPPVIEGTQYYEMLFWAGGHALQFTHTQFLMLSWLLLAGVVWQWKTLWYIAPVCAVLALYPLFAFDIAASEFRQFYTMMMIAGNGIAPAIMLLWLLRKLHKPHDAAASSLWASLLLFGYGGILGGMIHGQNVVIPAHYHGSIVGVTLAFMGLAYVMLPQFGYRDITRTRLAFWQPIVYAVGQAMHISGLAWSGGYGVLRKTPGGIDNVSMSVKAAMGFMGLGGLIAIVGGFMFVIAVWRAVKR